MTASALRRPLRAVVLLAALGACEHTAPFTISSNRTNAPLDPGSPARLTFNPFVDAWPAWLPDNSAFLYSQEQMARPDSTDQCLAVMPRTGGTVLQTTCPTTDPDGDSTIVFESASAAADRRLAYVRFSMLAHVGRATPDNGELVLANVGQPLATTVLETLPYFYAPETLAVDQVRDIKWVSPTAMVYIAEQVSYSCANMGCTTYDTSFAPIEIQRLDYSSMPPTVSSVANTTGASSASGVGDTIYFTVTGSGQVHRRALSSGADTVVFDFGAAATDVSVAGTRMVAVVDSTLHVVDLSTHADQAYLVPGSGIHHPALSPDGHLVVAEVAPGTTGPTGPADLWMWTLP